MKLYTIEQRIQWAQLVYFVGEERANELVGDTSAERYERALRDISDFRSEPSANHADGSEMREIANRALGMPGG